MTTSNPTIYLPIDIDDETIKFWTIQGYDIIYVDDQPKTHIVMRYCIMNNIPLTNLPIVIDDEIILFQYDMGYDIIYSQITLATHAGVCVCDTATPGST